MFAGNFAPTGWALCNGQLLPISQNTALFSLLGTYYGGNGTSNFGLPNLQASVAIGAGSAPGLTSYQLGDIGGEATVTLQANQVAMHNHVFNGAPAGRGDVANPSGNAPSAPSFNAYAAGPNGTMMNAGMLAPTAGSVPHNNLQPYQVVNFIIALNGVYPSRP